MYDTDRNSDMLERENYAFDSLTSVCSSFLVALSRDKKTCHAIPQAPVNGTRYLNVEMRFKID